MNFFTFFYKYFLYTPSVKFKFNLFFQKHTRTIVFQSLQLPCIFLSNPVFFNTQKLKLTIPWYIILVTIVIFFFIIGLVILN